jgi:hypothetical protein
MIVFMPREMLRIGQIARRMENPHDFHRIVQNSGEHGAGKHRNPPQIVPVRHFDVWSRKEMIRQAQYCASIARKTFIPPSRFRASKYSKM